MNYTYEEYQKTFYPKQWQDAQRPKTQEEWNEWIIKDLKEKLTEWGKVIAQQILER